MPLELRLDNWREAAGQIELTARLTGPASERALAWRVPARWRDAITPFADPFVIGFAFLMMETGEDVEVCAPVSPTLLANLEAYMDIWHRWVPGRYRRVRIASKEETEPPAPHEPARFVMPFSCGVDSCFTAFRHRRQLAGRNNRDVAIGITMYGFDIRDEDTNAKAMYGALAASAATMLKSIGMEHVELSTNFRTLGTHWLHSHATQLASGLSLFGRRFGGGLVPNSLPVNQLGTLWGSNPLTDPLLSSDMFRIIDDGAAVARWEKIEQIAGWREAMDGLRVCFGVGGQVGNCGVCEKCIRTALAFKIIGQPAPANLPNEITPKMFGRIRLKHDIAINYWHDIEEGIAAKKKEREPWTAGVRSTLRRAKRLRLEKSIKQPFVPLRNKIRAIFRGSTMSKKEQASQSTSSRTQG